jgi:hypothetical protein
MVYGYMEDQSPRTFGWKYTGMREREEVVTEVDNERCDGGCVAIVGGIHSQVLDMVLLSHGYTSFLVQLTLKSTLSPSDASLF